MQRRFIQLSMGHPRSTARNFLEAYQSIKASKHQHQHQQQLQKQQKQTVSGMELNEKKYGMKTRGEGESWIGTFQQTGRQNGALVFFKKKIANCFLLPTLTYILFFFFFCFCFLLSSYRLQKKKTFLIFFFR